MRNAQLGGWILAAVLVFAGAVPAQADREINLFFNNFESSAMGALPSPWQLVYDGTGTNQQVVSRDYAFLGSQSLKLVGRVNWSSVVQRQIKTEAPVLGSQFYILVSKYAATTGEQPAFFCQSAESKWGTFYGGVIFDHPSRKILDGRDRRVLRDWTPGVWYKVRTLADRVDRRAKIWVNDQLLVDGPMVGHPEWINSLSLVAGHSAVAVYYDNVRVFLPGVQEMGGLLLDEINVLASKPDELTPTNANRLRSQIQDALANEEGGDYDAAIDSLTTFLATIETWVHPAPNAPRTLPVMSYDHMTRLGEQMILQIQYRRSRS